MGFKIENGVLENCTEEPGVTVVVVPEGVTKIGSEAFTGLSSLESITLPDSVTQIGWSAFSGCTSLAGVTIPDSVTEIGRWAFSGCKNLIIRCRTGSYAEQYAKENEIEYVTTEE